jgi:uncharacterized membrane protein YcaP (DUF421 family)
MEYVLRAVSVYVVVWVLFRISGKRSLAAITTFDFVLLLIVAEALQQALTDRNHSVTASIVIVGTFLLLDILLSLVKRRFHRVEKVMDGVPVLLIEQGRIHEDRLAKERVDREDILAAARERLGIGRLEDIDYAVLELNGGISIIPKRPVS